MDQDGPEQFITGDWRSFTFHVATPKDCPLIVQHLGKHFATEEPLNRHVGGGGTCSENHPSGMEAHILFLFGHRLSFYITPKGSNEIIAVNIISDSRQPPPQSSGTPKPAASSPPPRSDERWRIRAFLSRLEAESQPKFESSFKCDFYAEIFMTSVHRDYHGQGIGTEMYERGLALLKAKGFPVVKSDFTHPGTQRIGQKLGFVELHRYYLKDAFDEGGMKLFPDAREHEYAVSVAKWL